MIQMQYDRKSMDRQHRLPRVSGNVYKSLFKIERHTAGKVYVFGWWTVSPAATSLAIL